MSQGWLSSPRICKSTPQDFCSAVLNVLQSLDVLAGDPTKKCVTVIQFGGDKDMKISDFHALFPLLCFQPDML